MLGTSAVVKFAELEHRIYEKLGIKVPIRAISYKGKKVLVFQIPSRRPATLLPGGDLGRWLGVDKPVSA